VGLSDDSAVRVLAGGQVLSRWKDVLAGLRGLGSFGGYLAAHRTGDTPRKDRPVLASV